MATYVQSQQNRANARAASARRRVRKRRRNHTLHYVLLLVFLLGAGAILSLTVLFKIEGVDVIGAEKYLPDDIAAQTGIELEDNLLRIDKKEIRQNLLEVFPYIETVEVRRRIPNRVEITVTHATPVGAILQGEEVALINAAGKVLERGLLMIPEGVPVVKGIELGDIQPGQVLGEYTPPRLTPGQEMTAAQKKERETAEEVQERMLMLHYLLVSMEESGFDNITNVDLTDRLNIKVNYENRLTLEFGSEAQLTDKLVMVKIVLNEYLSEDATGTVYSEIIKRRVRFRPASISGVEQEEIIYNDVEPENIPAEDEEQMENEDTEM